MSGWILKEKLKRRYLSEDGADVWFVFGNEKVPGHKFLLEIVSPWLNVMFNGSLPERCEVNMSNNGITVDAFKEFLRFIYLGEVNFTMGNIDEITHLAKLSLVEEFFSECEDFLIKSLTTENVFFAYQLALLYEADRLKKVCEEEIGSNAEKLLKTSTFLDFPYYLLENLLKCNTLTCKEKDIFDACIAWAKTACERNKENPSLPENIRAQLKDSIYQIRFSSMTIEEFAACILPCSKLFTNEELVEINCMIGRKADFEKKKFNWSARNFQRKKKRELLCSRWLPQGFLFGFDYSYLYTFGTVEQTIISCNRKLMLNGFTCTSTAREIGFLSRSNPVSSHDVDVIITKMNSDNYTDEIFNHRTTLNFIKYKSLFYVSNKAYVKLEPAILLRPNFKYSIEMRFQTAPHIHNHIEWDTRVRVDHDIVIDFDTKNGAISSLNISRIDEVGYFDKVLRNPHFYILTIMILLLLCITTCISFS